MKTSNNKLLSFINKLIKFIGEGDTPKKIFFVVLAIFLWFLTKLSKDGYTETIEFPVSYKNLSDDRSFGDKPLDKIKVTISSEGFNILKYVLPNFSKIKVDITEVERKAANGKSYWLTNSAKELVSNQLGPGIEVRNIYPDTVHFDFQELKKKKVPVRLKLEGSLPNSRSIYKEPELIPDSIWVSGPESKISILNEVYTIPWSPNAQRDSISASIDLDIISEDKLNFSEDKIDVKLRFTDVTEGDLTIAITVNNVPEDFQLRIFPSEIKLNYHVAIPDFNKVNASDFEILADYNELIENPDRQYLSLELKKFPDFVDFVSFEPKRVEYLLIAK